MEDWDFGNAWDDGAFRSAAAAAAAAGVGPCCYQQVELGHC